jgi:histidinol-phosphate aminotransferase
MACDFAELTAPGVAGLTPYQPGKPLSELEREYGIVGAVKLASNENPLGASPLALEAAREVLAEVARYPDGNGFELKGALSERLGVEAERLTLGNGSNEVLELVARAFLAPGREAVFSQYAFAVYPIVTQAVGARAVVVQAAAYGHDLQAMAQAVTEDTRVVFIANPNNPTGTWVNRGGLEAFLARVPERVLVVVDEAYTEYVQLDDYPNALAWLDRFPNLVVTRTFSKAYGLAGLRVGYAVSHPQVADLLNRLREPFNLNSVALAAARAALGDERFLARSREVNRAGLEQLTDGFRSLELEAIPSVANFITVKLPRPGAEAYEDLLRRGVIVRPLDPYGLPDHLRVTVGTLEENRRFLQALGEVL